MSRNLQLGQGLNNFQHRYKLIFDYTLIQLRMTEDDSAGAINVTTVDDEKMVQV